MEEQQKYAEQVKFYQDNLSLEKAAQKEWNEKNTELLKRENIFSGEKSSAIARKFNAYENGKLSLKELVKSLNISDKTNALKKFENVWRYANVLEIEGKLDKRRINVEQKE